VIEQPAPAQQPPVIIQQPAAPATQPAPIIVTPPAGGSTAGTMPTESMTTANMDSTVQAAVDKRLIDDPEFSTLGITASVINGKVMLVGTVKTEELKAKIERAVKTIKGVKEVDNQILVVPE
jgi:osmotically-inducible protein OsmY